MIVTTSNQATSENIEEAKKLAKQLGLPFQPRSELTDNLQQILIVVGREKIFLRYQNRNFNWHPNMAKLRILNIQRNGQDPLLKAAQPQTGDKILDCTLGLGADSLVLAYAVGPSGKVIALESEAAIAWLTRHGFTKLTDNLLMSLTQRIEILNASFTEYLQSTSEEQFDIIYFDPMFKKTRTKSTGIDILRLLGNHQPLSEVDLSLALRKSRRRVIVKESLESEFFQRFKPNYLLKTASDIGYGVYLKRDKRD